jgi:hypothetical protein
MFLINKRVQQYHYQTIIKVYGHIIITNRTILARIK